MENQDNDDAFEALKRVDPAEGSQVDSITLVSLIGDKLTPAHPRRNVIIAALVATVLALGAGTLTTWAFMRNSGEVSNLAEKAPVGPAMPSTNTGGADKMASSAMMGYGGKRHFSGHFEKSAGEGEVWVYDPASNYTKEKAEQFAKALGFSGVAENSTGAWVINSSDGNGPSLILSPYGSVNINYYNPQAQGWNCATTDMSVAKGEPNPSGGTDPAAPEPCVEKKPEKTLSDDELKTASLKILQDGGMNTDGLKVEIQRQDPAYASVNIYRADSGDQNPQWNFQWWGEKVSNFYGNLSELVSLGSYPTVSAQEALERLNDPRYGVMMSGFAIAYADGGKGVVAPGETTSASAPTMPSKGESIQWPWSEVKLVGARLSSVSYSDPQGREFLVPAWVFTDEEGNTWSSLALADSVLEH